MSATEYRLRWRRPGWRATTWSKSKLFQRQPEMVRHLAKLVAYGPLEDVVIEVRDCSPWREMGKP